MGKLSVKIPKGHSVQVGDDVVVHSTRSKAHVTIEAPEHVKIRKPKKRVDERDKKTNNAPNQSRKGSVRNKPVA